MYQVNVLLSDELAARVEEWLCGLDESHWCLLKEKDEQGFYMLQGFYEDQAMAQAGFDELKAVFTEIDATPEFVSYEDKDWQEAYKAYLKPWHSRNLHWVPVWEKENYNVSGTDVVLYFDAGMAFGTGAHETTQLCAERMLDYIEQHPDDFQDKHVIDAGCGSGILALSAKLLGFNNVYGFDIDPEAIQVSKENILFNGLPDGAVDFKAANLEEGLQNKKADLLLANIQSEILVPHAEVLLKSLKPGGLLVLSGILATELEDVRRSFSKTCQTLGLSSGLTVDSRVLGEWADIALLVTL